MKPVVRGLLVAWISAHAPATFAQALDPHAVQPERPTVATHAGTVAPGWWELEFGGEFDRDDDGTRTTVAPVIGKFGLTRSLQLSVMGAAVSPPGSGTVAAGDVGIGVKWRFADDAPLAGRVAIFPSVKLPTGSAARGAGTGTTDVGLLIISSHTFGPVALDINGGYTHRSGDGVAAPKTSLLWTVSFGGPAAGRVGWVAELYGYPKTSGPAGEAASVATLVGPTLMVRPWLALDAGAIVPVSGPGPSAWYLGGVWNAGRVWPKRIVAP